MSWVKLVVLENLDEPESWPPNRADVAYGRGSRLSAQCCLWEGLWEYARW